MKPRNGARQVKGKKGKKDDSDEDDGDYSLGYSKLKKPSAKPS
jgi:hypothetical protein